MPASEKPRKKHKAKKPRPAQGRQYSVGTADVVTELTLPSVNPSTGKNNVCLVRRVGVQGLIRMGILDSLDSLTALVQTEHLDRVSEGRSGTEVDLKAVRALRDNPEALMNGMQILDRVTVACLVEPKVEMPPTLDAQREPGVLYADAMSEDDKAFILQYVMGGTSDLESFRQGRQEIVDRLSAGTDVSVQAQ